MKLPGGSQNIGVQSLGREQLDDGTGAAKAGLASVVVEEVSAYQERETRHQLSMNDADMVAWDTDHSRNNDGIEYYEVSDLSTSDQKKYADQIGGQDRVPAYKLGAELYEAGVNEEIDRLAENISNERARDEWVRRMKGVAQEKSAQRYIDKDKQQIAALNHEAIDKADDLLKRGMYEPAKAMLDNSNLDANEIRDRKEVIDKRHETDPVAVMIDAKNLEGLKQMRQIFNATGYNGALDKPERAAILTTIRSHIDTMEEADRKIEIGTKAESHVKRAVDSQKSPAEQDEMISSIKDDEVRGEARKRIIAVRAREKFQRETEKRETEETFIEEFRIAMGSDMTVAYDLIAEAPLGTEAKVRKLWNSRNTGSEIKTDNAAYMKALEDALRGDFSPNDYLGKLSSTDERKLIDKAMSQKTTGLDSAAMSVDKDIKTRMVDWGYAVDEIGKGGKTRGKRAAAMYRVFETELSIAETAKGGNLTAMERGQLFDEMMINQSRTKDETHKIFGWEYSTEGEDFTLDDIPEADMPALIEAARAKRLEPTAANIREIYLDGK